MIPVYIASSDRFADVEPVIKYSIQRNCSVDSVIKVIRPQYLGLEESGCTGFTNIRFAIPELLRADGHEFGIYFDVDMLILGDVAELFSYGIHGRYVCLVDGSTEVAVVSSAVKMPPKATLTNFNKHELIQKLPLSRKIPLSWNVEDAVAPGANLIHFTDLKCQPWFFNNHPSPQAVTLWRLYADASKPV